MGEVEERKWGEEELQIGQRLKLLFFLQQIIILGMERGTLVAVITLLAIIGLDWMHFVVAGTMNDALERKVTDQFIAFIVVATVFVYIFAIILLLDLLVLKKLSRKWQLILIVLILVLEFALAVVIAIVASQASILRENLTHSNWKLDKHYDWAVADTVLTWLIKIVLLVVLFYLAVDSMDQGIPAMEGPAPGTADRM